MGVKVEAVIDLLFIGEIAIRSDGMDCISFFDHRGNEFVHIIMLLLLFFHEI
jgi:hypothetical protein